MGFPEGGPDAKPAGDAAAGGVARWVWWRVPGDEPGPRRLAPEERDALQAIARGSARHYRFPGNAEREFQQRLRWSSHLVRFALTLIGLSAFTVLPLLGLSVLDVPASLHPFISGVSFGLMVPVFIATTLVQLRWPLSAAAEWALILSLLAEMFAVEAIRTRCGEVGYFVDPAFSLTVPIAALVLPRLRLSRTLLIVLAYLGMLGLGPLLAPELVGPRSQASWLLEMVLLTIVLLGSAWNKLSVRREWAASVLLEQVAHSDPMTGLANRRAFEEHYQRLYASGSHAASSRLFLAIIDLDHFKAINDRYGHAYGDSVLVGIGQVLASFARRPLDLVARVGGEEFALLLHDCVLSDGRQRLQTLVRVVRELRLEHLGSDKCVVTCSAGGVAADAGVPLGRVLAAADRCLYEAKNGGRDTMRVQETPIAADPVAA
jgi:diguanylate cyclase (GGDEF)-like protein